MMYDDRKMAAILFFAIMDTSSHVFEFVALPFGLRAATVQHLLQSRDTTPRLVSSLDSIRLFVWHKRSISADRSH